MLRSSVDAVRPSADAKSIRLTSAIDESVGMIAADPTRLQQIVWNLLTNAVKFTPSGGSIELSAHNTRSSVQISVTDSGEGIDPNFLPHVFEPFKQAETPSTRVHGGLGLGLSIVRYMAEAHGGRVSAESAGRGKGAKFTVTLPVRALREASNEAEKRASGRSAAPPLKGRRILVVDDDREGRDLICAALRFAGAEVESADSAAAALGYVENQRPDLVLTDIAMPEMDGYTLQRKLRERNDLANTKIVALTAFPATAVSAKEEEFDSYLRKPIDPFELTQKISILLKTN
jgi:CheY-like chemotaxis protein/anti-sigma regulatory factor (Ser/Thr protein kinase)